MSEARPNETGWSSSASGPGILAELPLQRRPVTEEGHDGPRRSRRDIERQHLGWSDSRPAGSAEDGQGREKATKPARRMARPSGGRWRRGEGLKRP